MLYIPNRKEMTHLADSYMSEDTLVGPSIKDGFMTREEYITYTWINDFLIENLGDSEDLDSGAKRLLPQACGAAAKEFEISVRDAQDIWVRGCSVRARNIPGFEEEACELWGAEAAAWMVGNNNKGAEKTDD